MKKMKKEDVAYGRFKILMRNQFQPQSAEEVHDIANQIRKALRIKYYCTAFAGFVIGIPLLLLLIGFLIIPIAFGCIYEGRREVRLLNLSVERYIQDMGFDEQHNETNQFTAA